MLKLAQHTVEDQEWDFSIPASLLCWLEDIWESFGHMSDFLRLKFCRVIRILFAENIDDCHSQR